LEELEGESEKDFLLKNNYGLTKGEWYVKTNY
jgi:hypothetical protein